MKKEARSLVCSIIMGVCLLLSVIAQPVAAQSIKVGAILAITGPASFLGAPESRSLQMLVDQYNSQGGINGQQIELIIKDSGGSPEKAISFARQLIEEEKVFAIIGPSTSGETLKIKKICEKGKTPLISAASAQLIVHPVASYVFKTAPSDEFAARHIFVTMQKMGIKTIAVLAGNTGFGKAGKQQLVNVAPEYGISIVETQVYDKKATDLSALVVKLKARNDIEAIVNWSVVPAQSILAKNIRQAGWDIPLFQSHGFANIKYVQAAGPAAEGIIFPASPLLVADSLPAGEQKDFLVGYKNAYQEKFDEKVSTFAGHTYDAMLILAQAIKQAGNDRHAARDAIESIQNLRGTAGVFTFSPTDHNGIGMNAYTMLTVKDGRFVLFTPAAK